MARSTIQNLAGLVVIVAWLSVFIATRSPGAATVLRVLFTMLGSFLAFVGLVGLFLQHVWPSPGGGSAGWLLACGLATWLAVVAMVIFAGEEDELPARRGRGRDRG